MITYSRAIKRAALGGAGFVFFAVVAGACATGGTSNSGPGGGSSAECASDKDCKGTRVCQKGQCVDPTATSSSATNPTTTTGSGCSALPGVACSQASDCCTDPNKAPLGALCIQESSGGATCHAKCTTNSQCASGCCAGVQGGGNVCAAASNCQALKGIGDACSSSSECASNSCNGWCTEYCSATNKLCLGSASDNVSNNSNGHVNWCVQNNSGSDICFPGCSTTADCAPYPGTTCKYVTTVADGSDYVCAG